MSDDPKKPNGGPAKAKAEKPAHPTESGGFPVAVLLREEGAYKAGLRVTTDPSRPSNPSGPQPIRVDAGRFAAWAKGGAFEKIEKPPEKTPPAETPPLVPMDETPPEEPETKKGEED